MAEFKLPPISTLAGSTLSNYLRALSKGKIEPKFYVTITLTFLVILVASPFHLWEFLYFKFLRRKTSKVIKPPLFILGHWRSGTTLLHNMLCQDPRAAFITTYHGLFPSNLASKIVFKNFMKLSMPSHRPSDGMALNVDYPQEDDFAVGNLSTHSYYHFFYFPEKYKSFYEKSVRFTDNPSDAKEWQVVYRKMIDKAIINTSGSRAVLKSPVNTGRIDQLLEIYPGAKFVYIYRNPFAVYLSTYKFFDELFPTLWLHEIPQSLIEDLIFDIFKKLIHDYETKKSLIPSENLIEIKFEEFEKSPLQTIEILYEKLLEDDFEVCRQQLETYYDSIKGHKKNTYKISRRIYDRINKEWNAYIESKDYALPENIEIVEDAN